MSDENIAENQILTIEIEYENFISLSEFYQSLEGWNNQYDRYISLTYKGENCDKLLVKKVRDGSIILELASSVMPLISDCNTILLFFEQIKNIFNWLTTKIGNKPKLEITDLENTKKIIAPIESHSENKINIFIQGDNNASIILNSKDTSIISNNINEELKNLNEPKNIKDDIKENVIMKLKQIKNDETSKNTKGIIHEIDAKEHTVLFTSPSLKNDILHTNDNPFLMNYLVNVKIHKENNVIKAFIILDIKDSYFPENYEMDLFHQKI